MSVAVLNHLFDLAAHCLGYNPFSENLRAAPGDAACRAYGAAGGGLVIVQALNAKVAFYGKILAVIILHRPKRAGFQTLFAADTKRLVNKHHTLSASGYGLDRTGIFTGCVGTVVTVNGKIVRGIFNYAYQPGTDAQLMLLFAGNFTGMAAHAFFFIKHQR